MVVMVRFYRTFLGRILTLTMPVVSEVSAQGNATGNQTGNYTDAGSGNISGSMFGSLNYISSRLVKRIPSNFFLLQFYKFKDFGNKNTSILIYILIALLSLDTVIHQLSAGLGIPVSSPMGIALFLVIGGINHHLPDYYILQFVSRTSLAIRRKVKHIGFDALCSNIMPIFHNTTIRLRYDRNYLNRKLFYNLLSTGNYVKLQPQHHINGYFHSDFSLLVYI